MRIDISSKAERYGMIGSTVRRKTPAITATVPRCPADWWRNRRCSSEPEHECTL